MILPDTPRWKEIFEEMGRSRMDHAMHQFLSEEALMWGPSQLEFEHTFYTPSLAMSCGGWLKDPKPQTDGMHRPYMEALKGGGHTAEFVACTKGHKDGKHIAISSRQARSKR